MTRTKLISITQPVIDIEGQRLTPEALMVYCARVSSPNQENPEYAKLLAYCIKHGHWSVFELCDMTVEIETSLAIAAQILRHRSFVFQQFSRRYSGATPTFEDFPARRQDLKNRQNSIDDFDEEVKEWWQEVQDSVGEISLNYYLQALDKGIAKECARAILPNNTSTVLYMKGSVRSWIHYLQVRCSPGTQLEHREVAMSIKEDILKHHFPVVYEAAFGSNSD